MTSVRRALVTGGSGAIGGAICRRLAEDGCHVLVHANQQPARAVAVVEAIREAGGSAEPIGFDVTDASAAAAALDAALAAGPIQVLVHNAGIFRDAPLAGMSEADWRQVIAVALDGFYNVTRPLLLPMLRTRWGRIVAVSSVSGLVGNRGQTNYAAAKAGLHGASKSLALEVASRGVTVNVVCPGVIDTPEVAALFPAERIKTTVPVQRAGQVGEVADLVGFLASERAAYITRQVIAIDGGMT